MPKCSDDKFVLKFSNMISLEIKLNTHFHIVFLLPYTNKLTNLTLLTNDTTSPAIFSFF